MMEMVIDTIIEEDIEVIEKIEEIEVIEEIGVKEETIGREIIIMIMIISIRL